MKNILTTAACGLMLASSLSADFTRVEMGAGVWDSEPKGEISYTASGITAHDISKQESKTQPYLWLMIKHPIPVIPNLRLEYVDVSSKGLANGTYKNFTASGAQTQLDITQYDIIPYYNILDNTFWVTLDLGLDIKIAEVKYKADGVTGVPGGGTTYSESETIPIPMLYARARTQIPATDIGLEADVKYVTYNSSSIYDARVKVDYTLDFVPVIQPALEVGYRVQKYKIDNSSFDEKIDLKFSGFYAGLMLRF